MFCYISLLAKFRSNLFTYWFTDTCSQLQFKKEDNWRNRWEVSFLYAVHPVAIVYIYHLSLLPLILDFLQPQSVLLLISSLPSKMTLTSFSKVTVLLPVPGAYNFLFMVISINGSMHKHTSKSPEMQPYSSFSWFNSNSSISSWISESITSIKVGITCLPSDFWCKLSKVTRCRLVEPLLYSQVKSLSPTNQSPKKLKPRN